MYFIVCVSLPPLEGCGLKSMVLVLRPIFRLKIAISVVVSHSGWMEFHQTLVDVVGQEVCSVFIFQQAYQNGGKSGGRERRQRLQRSPKI